MLNYKVILHKPKLFARIFGLKLDKFSVLVKRMKVIWDENELRMKVIWDENELRRKKKECLLWKEKNICE